MKSVALGKLLQISNALGIKAQKSGRFNLSDLSFYLEQLEKVEEK